ncbi:MAG: hypothetical protein ACYDHH_06295 [Solirubrobacteraceae bacterium]
MSFTTAEGRRQVLDDLADGADQIGVALAALGEAYERLDEQTGDRLEEQLFRPVQAAYGRAKRTHSEFSTRAGMRLRSFPEPDVGLPAEARDEIARAVDQIQLADETLAGLQDSMLPVEVGDPELRAGLSEVRSLIAPIPVRARELLRTLGR